MDRKQEFGVLEIMFGGDNMRLKDLAEEAKRYVESEQPIEKAQSPGIKFFRVDPPEKNQ